jgi:cysteine dioxygenase
MPAPATPPCLSPLLRYLDGLTERASVERVRELLEESEVTRADLLDFVDFSSVDYRRNLVRLGPLYEVLVICWRSGQRSPIHDHAMSTCGFKVLSGVASETVFAPSPCGQVVALQTVHLAEGHVGASQDADTHQVSNLQLPGRDLVTLHVYSPPLRSMTRFSITGAGPSVWQPHVFDFVQGAGI